MQNAILENNNCFNCDPAINTAGFTVTMTAMGEDGSILTDSTNTPILGIVATFDAIANVYFTSFQFNPSTPLGYIRLYWTVLNAGVAVAISDSFTPADAKLFSSGSVSKAQVVPTAYFWENFLASETSLNDLYKKALASFVASGKIKLQEYLLAGQGDLERETRIKFVKTPCHMSKDFYSQEFRSEWWMQQVYWYPLVSVENYKLVYGNQAYNISNNLAESMVVDTNLGTLEFVPATLSGNLFSVIVSTVSALGLTIVTDGGSSRIPCLFQIDYTAGVDFTAIDEAQKASMRQAVCRAALIQLLPIVDPILRETSKSMSIDGASKSYSSGMDKILKGYEERQARWIQSFKSQYGTDVPIAVV